MLGGGPGAPAEPESFLLHRLSSKFLYSWEGIQHLDVMFQLHSYVQLEL